MEGSDSTAVKVCFDFNDWWRKRDVKKKRRNGRGVWIDPLGTLDKGLETSHILTQAVLFER